LKSQLHILHVLKDAKPVARRSLLTSASDDSTKVIVACAINAINSNHKLSKEEKGKLSKYKNRLKALVNRKISFKNKGKLLIQTGGFTVPLLNSILSGGKRALINNNSSSKWLCSYDFSSS
jgi:hypothetical protein